jgi:outer membrane protein TolC
MPTRLFITNFAFIFLFLSGVFAQTLTLQDAIAICLEKNYDIALAKDDSAIAKRNNTIGNAGMLPSVNLNAGVSYGLGNLNQQFTNGTEINRNNVNSLNANASANLNWTLFDGLKMFFTKQRLSMQEALATLQLKDKVQSSVAATITAYVEVVKQKQTVNAYQEAIRLADERLKIAATKVELGVSAKTDALQAKVDLNARKSELLKQQAQLESAKQALNSLLARNVETTFDVEDSIAFNTAIAATSLQDANQNFAIQSALMLAGIAKQQLKETQAKRSPVIIGNAAYSYTYARSDAGFSLFNQQNGLAVGATLSFPIFNGFNLNREVKVAKINVAKSEVNAEQVKLQQTVQIKKAARDYSAALEVLKLEEENIGYAKENVLIATERFKLSQGTSIEYREAQKSYEDAMLRLVAARYDVKKAETDLLRLSSKLVQ